MNEYSRLESVFKMAVEQASEGKGKERHATVGESFEHQQIVEIGKRLSGNIAAGPDKVVAHQLLNVREDATRFNRHGVVLLVELAHPVHSAGRQQYLLRAPVEAGNRAAG